MKNNDITILKFGGTSMGSVDTIIQCVNVIKEKLDDNKKPFIVVSAISKMTDTLLKLLNLAKNKKKQDLNKLFKDIKERHFKILNSLTDNSILKDKYTKIFNDKFLSLFEILNGILLITDYSNKVQAIVLSYGEDLSSDLMELCLINNNINAKKIHSKNLVKTEGNYLSAKVDFTKTKNYFKKIVPNIENGKVFVMTGFFGAGKNKEIMLLGRGGSDFSSSIAGIALNADVVEIWTDVDGIMSADPELVETAKSWEVMNKNIVSEMARAGAKVLHPKTICALYYHHTAIVIKNLFDKNFKGTIVNSESCADGVKGIVSSDGYSMLHLENQDMFGISGFIAELGIIANNNNVKIDMIATSETSITFTTKTEELTNNVIKLFKAISDFSITNGIVKVSIIGENIATSEILEKTFDSLNKVNINPLLSVMGKSKNNIGIALKKDECNKALIALHKTFINI